MAYGACPGCGNLTHRKDIKLVTILFPVAFPDHKFAWTLCKECEVDMDLLSSTGTAYVLFDPDSCCINCRESNEEFVFVNVKDRWGIVCKKCFHKQKKYVPAGMHIFIKDWRFYRGV
jgi:hypothetical protein